MLIGLGLAIAGCALWALGVSVRVVHGRHTSDYDRQIGLALCAVGGMAAVVGLLIMVLEVIRGH